MNYGCFYPGAHMPKRGYIKVDGTGKVHAVPDTAIVNLGVVTENINLEAARRENAALSTAVINILTNLGIDKKHIRTGAFSIDPLYDYNDGKQLFRGYRVTNLLNVTIKDIARVGEIIDRSVSAGANRADGISFTLSDQALYYDKALRLALRDAMHKASEIGTALDIALDDVPYRIVEKSAVTPGLYAAAEKLSSPVTPVLPGQMEITAMVEVIIGYSL